LKKVDITFCKLKCYKPLYFKGLQPIWNIIKLKPRKKHRNKNTATKTSQQKHHFMGEIFSITTPTDQLIQGCKSKNRLAQRYLYERFFTVSMTKVLRYTKNDRDQALDILNRAFLKIFTSIEQFRGENFDAWVSKIVVNAAIDAIRAQASYSENISLEDYKNDYGEEAAAVDLLNISDLGRLINELSSATRTVFIMQAIDGYKQTEIAELLKISEGTVKWHFSNAKKQLQHKILNHY
jgi:RNA polymerase sigma-70 factor (ECF subfamily)